MLELPIPILAGRPGGAFELEFAEPELVELEFAEPELVELEFAEPELVELEFAEPELVELEFAEPEFVELEFAVSGFDGSRSPGPGPAGEVGLAGPELIGS
ncbi:hypothetical protein LBHB_02920 [Leptospira borgpetersenii serovar Hardjo]|nr:hypothetical protein LBHB_02920 [Leptospira borgpetersenii serovar Hardjo]